MVMATSTSPFEGESKPLVRIVVVFTNYGPYHVARAKGLRQIPDIDAHFIELASQEARYPWRSEKVAISDRLVTLVKGSYERSSRRALRMLLIRELSHMNPDVVVIAGYSEGPMRDAARWARRRRRRVILMSETTRWDRRRPRWRELLKRYWVKRYVDAAFVGAGPQAQYLVELGVPRERIIEGYDVVDNEYFARGAKDARVHGEARRRALGLPQRYFLFVGRFAPEKNLNRLLEAYRRYRESQPDGWGLVLVGDGPEASSIRRWVARLALSGLVLSGFRLSDELPSFYGLAGGFVLPSIHEPWGLVVNEAMASSLPVLVSNRCGAAAVLVRHGQNGLIFNPWDPEDIARSLGELSSLKEHRLAAFGARSSELIREMTPATWGERLGQAVRLATEMA